MKSKILLAAFALLLATPTDVASADPPAPAASARPAPVNANEVAGRVQAFYNTTRTFSATFQQDYKVKAYNTNKHSAGKVVFEKPGKMRWTYDQPNGNVVVSDGTTLKVYEKENQQMYETPLGKSQYPAALAFLMGTGDLASSFNLKLLDAKKMKFEGGYVLEGTPKAATPAYQKVLIYVDAGSAQVRRMVILDAQGNRNTFTFETPQVNTPVPAGDFTFTPPAGTQIVRP